MRKNPVGPAAPAERSHVASLQKGLDVLTCFSRARPKLTVSEAAQLTGMTPASARRALLTLHALGYLQHDGKRFWLLPKVLLVANAYLSSRPAPDVLQPVLDELAERTRDSASAAKLLHDQTIIIARSTARRSLAVGLRIGSCLPAYCSATGYVLLAALAPADAARRVRAMSLRPYTLRTPTDAGAVLQRIDACREAGFAISDGELELDVRSLAVPVLNHQGEVIAALSIAVRADRTTREELESTFLPALRQAQVRLRELLFED